VIKPRCRYDEGMSLHPNNNVLLSGVIVGDIHHTPGKLLRFTLAGQAYKYLDPTSQVRYYQEVVVPGARADDLHTEIVPGRAYVVQGPLEERGKRHQIKTFDITPIHRDVQDEGGGTDTLGQTLLADGISSIQIVGNIGSPPRKSMRGTTLMARASIATNYRVPRSGGWEMQTHWIPVMAEGEVADSLLSAERGSRVVIIGNLMTERFVLGEGESRQTVKRSVGLISVLDYVGHGQSQEDEGEEPNEQRLDDPDAPDRAEN